MRTRWAAHRGGVVVVTLALTLALAPAVLARSSYLGNWQTRYPSSTSDDAGCTLCHGASTSTWNAYGWAIYQQYQSSADIDAAIAAAEAGNADADPTGTASLGEITANTQPGWTYGANNRIYSSDGSYTLGAAPAGLGLLDPVTLVAISDDAFTPSAAKVKLGGTVQWERTSGSHSHNVAELHGIFTSGTATTGAISYHRTFSAGTFPYACEVHAAMTGKVSVAPKIGAVPTGLPFTVSWATKKTDTGSTFGVQYKVGTGKWKTWYASTKLKKAVFGASGSPVKVVAGTAYAFRVRSGTGSAWSGYSPVKTFTA